MLNRGSWIRAYDWSSTTWLGALSTPSGYIAMGASPPTSGAIRIDGATYSNIAFRAVSGAQDLRIWVGDATFGRAIGSFSGDAFRFIANNDAKWMVNADATGTSTLTSSNVTARIVGGSTNGLAIRNSGNTRDNLRIFDDGSTYQFAGATYTASLASTSGSGELPAGWAMQASSTGSGLFICTQGTTGSKTGFQYYNQTQRYSAVEVADVASGFSTLALMKSGGAVVIGTDPGGTSPLRVGGNILGSSNIFLGQAAYIEFNARGRIYSPADGTHQFSNSTNASYSSMLRGPSASATSIADIQKAITAIADATPTDVLTVTIPNSVQTASLRVTLKGALGAGGAIGADEATGTVTYDIAIARTAGVNAVAVISSAYGSATANVAGAATITVAGTLSAIAGAVGASNTFTVQVTITRGSGASTNHTCMVFAQLMNGRASGITIA